MESERAVWKHVSIQTVSVDVRAPAGFRVGFIQLAVESERVNQLSGSLDRRYTPANISYSL